MGNKAFQRTVIWQFALSTLDPDFRRILQQLYEALASTGLPAILIVDESHADLLAVIKDFGIHDYLTTSVSRESLMARIEAKFSRTA